MYICPTCEKNFATESEITKHLSVCWKEKNPNHKSTPAPHSADIIRSQMSNDVLDFFNSFIPNPKGEN